MISWKALHSRAYDRSLLAQQHPTHPQTYHPRSPANKTPRATHAWEYSARPRNSVQRKNPSPDWQHTHPGPQQHSHPGQHYTRPDPSVLYHDVGSHLRGTPRQRADAEERAMDRVRRASGLTRALQVVSLIVFSAVMFGGVGNASRCVNVSYLVYNLLKGELQEIAHVHIYRNCYIESRNII